MPPSAKRILIAPLDWGLGHTTRCIPIIRAIQEKGHEVVFAGDKRQRAFIRQTFPELKALNLEGYNVRYSRSALMFTLLWQLPRLIRTVRSEHKWLQRIVEEEAIDGIISDNRYGLWHNRKPSIIITHQPGIITGLGTIADRIVQALHYHFLNRFGEVWIPDLPGATNLAGRLSHPAVLPRYAHYIGWLSQFNKNIDTGQEKQHVLILLSGPEPQRSLLADRLWQQAVKMNQEIVFVEGRADANRKDIPGHIRYFPIAGAATLQPLINNASLVICRSGYSTLMDLARLGKSAVLIPTPGQTEQEYLADSLTARGIFSKASQDRVSLSSVVSEPSAIHPAPPEAEDLAGPVLAEWLSIL